MSAAVVYPMGCRWAVMVDGQVRGQVSSQAEGWQLVAILRAMNEAREGR